MSELWSHYELVAEKERSPVGESADNLAVFSSKSSNDELLSYHYVLFYTHTIISPPWESSHVIAWNFIFHVIPRSDETTPIGYLRIAPRDSQFLIFDSSDPPQILDQVRRSLR